MNEKNKNELDENETGFIVASIIALLIIIGLWIATYYTLKDMPSQERGTLGDMFGSINALFSGLALAGIILTILLQRKELKLQRQELQDTREEFETQNETLKLQRFENTFFNILNLHHQIVAGIDYRYYKNKEKSGPQFRMIREVEDKEAVILLGRDVFRHRYKSLYKEISQNKLDYKSIYLRHYSEAQTDFGHYFRNLYRMIKLVDQTDFFYDMNKVSKKDIFNIKIQIYKYYSITAFRLRIALDILQWYK